MPTISDQLQELVKQKNTLVDNLNTKGVTATSDEKLNTLVPKVLDIKSSGTDTSDASEITSNDVLNGKVVYGSNGKVTGGIPVQTPKNYTPSENPQTIKAGYYSSDQIIYGDEDLKEEYIKNGVTIFGKTGRYTKVALDENVPEGKVAATSNDILDGKAAYADGNLLIGTIPSKPAQTFTPTVSDITIDAGQYLVGDQIIKGDNNLKSENIASGVTIFGVAGRYTGVKLEDTTATEYDILEGKTAYCDGIFTTGVVKSLISEKEVSLVIEPSVDGKTFNGPAFIPANKSLIFNHVSVSPDDIAYGSNVFGVDGTCTQVSPSEAAISDNVLSGKKYFVNGKEEKIGTMKNINADETVQLKPSATENRYTEYNGYLSNPYYIPKEPQMISENIRDGAYIYDVEGTFTRVSNTQTAATTDMVLSGATFFVNGTEYTGEVQSITSYDYEVKEYDQTIKGPRIIETGKTITFRKPDIAQNLIKCGESVYGTIGTFTKTTEGELPVTSETVLNGRICFVNGEKIIGTMIQNPVYEDYTPINPYTLNKESLIIPTADKHVTDNITVTWDANITPSNIMKGKTIYGVTGTFTTASDTEAAKSSDILKDKVAYVNGEKIIGTLDSSGGTTYEDYAPTNPYVLNKDKLETPIDLVIPTADKHVTDNITVTWDTNITPGNIKNGVTIYGVTGTLDSSSGGGGTTYEDYTPTNPYTLNKESLIIPTKDKHVTDNITVTWDANITPGNIMKGVTIYGVTGTLNSTTTGYDTSDATVTAETLIEGIIAYGKNGKVTGTYKPSELEVFNPEESYTFSTTNNNPPKDIVLETTNKHVTKNIIIKSDLNLLARNIKKDVTIFGIKGTYTGNETPIETTIFDVSTSETPENIISKYGTDIHTFRKIGNKGEIQTLKVYDWDTNLQFSAHNSTTDGILCSGINLIIDTVNFPNSCMFFDKEVSITEKKILLGLRTYASSWGSKNIIFSLFKASDIYNLNDILTDSGISAAVFSQTVPINSDSNSNGSTLHKYFVELSNVPIGEYFLVLSSTVKKQDVNDFILNYLSYINIKDGEATDESGK